jgi:transposase
LLFICLFFLFVEVVVGCCLVIYFSFVCVRAALLGRVFSNFRFYFTMGRGAPEDAEAKRKLAADMLNAKKPFRAIATILGVSVGFVQNVKAKIDAGLPLHDAPRSGRPPATSPREDRAIVREMEQDPFSSAAEVVRRLDLTVSSRTVRRRLRGTGRRNFRSHKKCYLTGVPFFCFFTSIRLY